MVKSLTQRITHTMLTSALVLGTVAGPMMATGQDYDSLISNAQVEIEELSAEQADLYMDLLASYEEINQLKEESGLLANDVATSETEAETLAEEIQHLEELIANREVLLAEQARAVQVSGGSANYLNYVASSKTVTDFVGRVDVINKMVSANKDLLEVQIADKEAVESKQAQVEALKASKIEKLTELEALKADLADKLVAQEDTYEKLTQDINLAAETRDELVTEKANFEEAQRIATAQAEANQIAMEASIAAAAQAESDLALQTQYEQALAEAQAQDAAIAQAQAEAEAAAVAEANAIAEAEAAEAAALEAQNYVASVEAQEVPVEVYYEEPVYAEEPVYTEETTLETDLTIPEDAQAWEAVEETTVAPTPQVDTQAQAEAQAQAQAEAEAARLAELEAARIAAAEAEAAAEAARIAAEQAQEVNANAQANVNQLISNAEKYLGTPYVWGGKSPSGFDCSGFVQYVFRETYGVDIGGYTGAQQYSGTQISVAEAQPGDLYFWGASGSTYHVAIATGEGNYIHASQPGTPLEYNRISSYFMPNFALRVNK